MGKKQRKNVSYDKEALKSLQKQLSTFRKPLQDGNIPQIKGDLDDLGKAITLLPKNSKEALERFWGLIPGTTNHGKTLGNGKKKDLAYQNMWKLSNEAFKDLHRIEFLYVYDANVRKLVRNILTKINRNGLDISEIDAIKYFLIYLVFIAGGHKMIFEEKDQELDLMVDEMIHFDEYGLLFTLWEESCYLLEDNSINLGFLIDIIEMFDLEDVTTMKKFVRLPLDKQEMETEKPQIYTFKEVREVKEKIFKYGAWNVTSEIIYGVSLGIEQAENLLEQVCQIRNNWSAVLNFKVGTEMIKRVDGNRIVDVYQIDELQFTDLYELMSLYACRKWL